MPTFPLITRAEAEKNCGSCFYGHDFREGPLMPVVANAIECRGIPPTPVIMGQGPNGAAVGLMRPRIAKTEPGCALWREKCAPTA